ncbi:MAG: ATP synthase F0 subunit C [Bacteroidales bacterium]
MEGLSAFAAAIAVIGAAMGIGRIGAQAMEAIARQPEAASNIQTSMIISAALIEGVALFAVVVALIA